MRRVLRRRGVVPVRSCRLVTVPFSHYCEKARWGLDRAGVRYVEEGHAPVFHYPFTLLRGGGRTVPVLVTPDGVQAESGDILRWADRVAAPGRALYPTDPVARREVDALERRFDAELGTAARVWSYHHLLPHRAPALRLLGHGLPAAEAAALPLLLPVARRLIQHVLALSDASAAAALGRVDAIFTDVEQRLGSGRRYLVGDALSAADITFAALCMPVLGVPETRLPFRPGDLPPVMEETIARLRRRPAGAFVTRLYREDRDGRS
jgi:glutathione S-transferase